MNFFKDIFKGCVGGCTGCGCFTIFTIFCVFMIIAIFSEDASESMQSAEYKTLPSVLVLDLSTPISESATQNEKFINILSGKVAVGFYDLTRAIYSAKDDDKISALFIKGNFSSASAEQIWEILEALKEFKKVKPVIAYLENPSLAEYYLASCATYLYINPMSEFEFKGMALSGVFFGNALKKYGIDAQVIKAGKYKSFGETFTSDKMSTESRENLESVASVIWQNILSEIAQNRKIPVEKLKEIANSTPLMSASEAKQNGFVDEITYRDALVAHICQTYIPDAQISSFKQISLLKYIEKISVQKQNFFYVPNHIAIVYMDGSIVEEGSPLSDIESRHYCPLLRQLKDSEEVKAVVLRINSGGGSAFASEQLRREIEMIALEKPVYASFGDVSASGAYWLSTACKKIVAGKNGITGSIGVFGLNFSAQKLANNFGITFDGVKTEKYADMPTISRPLNPEELAIFQKSVNRTYEKFLSLVSQGRNLAIEDVATLAEGKIYTSTQAKKLGLVDEIYTLYTLVERVKQNAENDCLDRLAVLEYPTLPTFVELLQSMEILETPFVKTLSSVFAPKFTNEALLNTKFFERFKNAKSREVQAELPIILTSEF